MATMNATQILGMLLHDAWHFAKRAADGPDHEYMTRADAMDWAVKRATEAGVKVRKGSSAVRLMTQIEAYGERHGINVMTGEVR